MRKFIDVKEIFKVIKKMKTLPRLRRGRTLQNLLIFWDLTHKNIPYRQQYVYFRKLQKSSKSLHPIIRCILFWQGFFLAVRGLQTASSPLSL